MEKKIISSTHSSHQRSIKVLDHNHASLYTWRRDPVTHSS